MGRNMYCVVDLGNIGFVTTAECADMAAGFEAYENNNCATHPQDMSLLWKV
jgi:hypothetical protein